jgi:opacity protein-like surface antigen
MKRALIKNLTLAFTLILSIAISSSMATAQGKYCDRCMSWELILPVIFTDPATITGSGGSHADLNDDWSPGFGFGYNFNAHFQANGTFTWSSRGYSATSVQQDGMEIKYNGTMETATIGLNGIYYLLNKNFTPFLSAGIGWTNLDTNIPSGRGYNYCYWDPWWGYVCDSYVPTKSEDDFSYNAGLGIRWDINDTLSLQGSYNKMWIAISKASGGTPEFTAYKLELIMGIFD